MSAWCGSFLGFSIAAFVDLSPRTSLSSLARWGRVTEAAACDRHGPFWRVGIHPIKDLTCPLAWKGATLHGVEVFWGGLLFWNRTQGAKLSYVDRHVALRSNGEMHKPPRSVDGNLSSCWNLIRHAYDLIVPNCGLHYKPFLGQASRKGEQTGPKCGKAYQLTYTNRLMFCFPVWLALMD